ncbi:hypothetical protein [Nocardia sp. NPDC002869]|uniref:hypothetical protein n=1 Tax=Nocardia sp. NPDC002869 TaxID=3161032 RepID=UPI00398D48F1
MTVALDVQDMTVDVDGTGWVVTYPFGEPRNGASGLVPRSVSRVPAWDYHRAAQETPVRDRSAVEAAKANPTDRMAGLRAYGLCQ